jgi:hypothetical protein
MSALKKGTICIIIAGCPENIGMLVEIIAHLGTYGEREDAYEIKTITGRNFNQLWNGSNLIKGYSKVAITDRHKLRPLEDGEPPNNDALAEDEELLLNT